MNSANRQHTALRNVLSTLPLMDIEEASHWLTCIKSRIANSHAPKQIYLIEMIEDAISFADGVVHETEEEEVDQYGNPTSGDRTIHCCFPDCGCDGSRLCMAERGANSAALSINIERGASRWSE